MSLKDYLEKQLRYHRTVDDYAKSNPMMESRAGAGFPDGERDRQLPSSHLDRKHTYERKIPDRQRILWRGRRTGR